MGNSRACLEGDFVCNVYDWLEHRLDGGDARSPSCDTDFEISCSEQVSNHEDATPFVLGAGGVLRLLLAARRLLERTDLYLQCTASSRCEANGVRFLTYSMQRLGLFEVV